MRLTSLILLILLFLSGCSTYKPSALQYDTLKTPAMSKALDYGVYTPPGWTKAESLPLILFLHGGGDTHTSFEKFSAHQYFDEQISAGNMPRVIVLTPNGKKGFWENWHDGSYNYRDWILDNVLPKVQSDFNTLPCPEHCHLAGISMGGFGVLRFAYFANDQFSSVSAISAAIFRKEDVGKEKAPLLARLLFPLKRIFGEDFEDRYAVENPFDAWVNNPELQNMRLQLIWGDNDRQSIIKSNEEFHQHLLDNGIEHDMHVYQGRHKWVSWVPNFNRVVNFLVDDQ